MRMVEVGLMRVIQWRKVLRHDARVGSGTHRLFCMQKFWVPEQATGRRRRTLGFCIPFLLLLLFPLISPTQKIHQLGRHDAISILLPQQIDTLPIVRHAVDDVIELLQEACECEVGRNIPGAGTVLKMPKIDFSEIAQHTSFAEGRDYPYLHYPAHDYAWTSRRYGTSLYHSLQASTPHGIANGLYGLLQEKLGFMFVHARQTVIPCMTEWPLNEKTALRGKPNFDKKGFHLHTMHPLELAQPLHDPDFPSGQAMIREYIDWLARNGQNYFDFSLMEGVDEDLERWVRHAKEFVDYAHERGILCGVDISLHMVQQNAYKLVNFPPKTFKPYEAQIRDRMHVLMQAGWDVINFEFALAEFVGGMEKMRNRLREVVLEVVAEYPKLKLVGRQHVVKPDAEIGGSHGDNALNIATDNSMGLLVHTVMCYGIRDEKAPVYELENFHHLFDMLVAQNKVRETWYYPESAYWVTFDNSVPMFLMPYLGARFRDIEEMKQQNIPGHLTFTSGWEWGYWLVDWSIARWSWDYADERGPLKRGPLQYLWQVFKGTGQELPLKLLADVMDGALIEENMLQYLCPSSPMDEFPAAFSKQFQPRPPWALTKMHRARNKELLGELVQPAFGLQEFAAAIAAVSTQSRNSLSYSESPVLTCLREELLDAISITGLRAAHRSAQLMALVHQDEKYHADPTRGVDAALQEAADIRAQAQAIVDRQQQRYRYPLELLAGTYRSYTAYDFGYLHTVRDLHFWQREEAQLRRHKSGPFFMNKYDLLRIAGFRD